MYKKKIPNELKKLAPFYHDIDLGSEYSTSPNTYRMENAINLFFPPLLRLSGKNLKGKRVLDVGCNCGGFAFAAHRFGASEVVGIDPRDIHIKQANAIKEYLKINNVNFYIDRIENITPEKYGQFDICILAGVIYHLKDPVNAIEIVSNVTTDIVMVDSHVHFSEKSPENDIPSWWMIVDTDMNDFDGLYLNHKRLSKEKYIKFEREHDVNYSNLNNQFMPSPQTDRDLQFINQSNPNTHIPTEDALNTIDTGSLSMVPNKKALVKLLRWGGFEDILEIEPQRFSENVYITKIRVGLFGLKRNNYSYFPMSEWASKRP